ncbi:MAG TPA: hypothetical protein VI958_04075, partial [Acidobacteriota bacterium]
MKRTLPVFITILALSAFIYPLFSDSRYVLIFGNSAQIAGLIFALLQFLHLANISMKSDPLHSAWVRCAFGVFVWLIAQLLEFYCEMVLNLIAYGTIADAFWVIGYFPLILGFHSVVKHAMAGAETFTGKWMLLFFSAAYVILFVFLILPQWQHPQTWGEAVLDFAYPTFDFILLTQAFLVMKSTGSGKPLFRFALLAQASFL